MNFDFDFKQFYLTAQGRVNRKQWWLRLVVPFFIISVVLTLIDMAIRHLQLAKRGWPAERAVRARGADSFDPGRHQALA